MKGGNREGRNEGEGGKGKNTNARRTKFRRGKNTMGWDVTSTKVEEWVRTLSPVEKT